MQKIKSRYCISATSFIPLFLILSLSSCTMGNDPEKLNIIGYDVILVIGQSNTHQGIGFNPILDVPEIYIKQLGRFDGTNQKNNYCKGTFGSFLQTKKQHWICNNIRKSISGKVLVCRQEDFNHSRRYGKHRIRFRLLEC